MPSEEFRYVITNRTTKPGLPCHVECLGNDGRKVSLFITGEHVGEYEEHRAILQAFDHLR